MKEAPGFGVFQLVLGYCNCFRGVTAGFWGITADLGVIQLVCAVTARLGYFDCFLGGYHSCFGGITAVFWVSQQFLGYHRWFWGYPSSFWGVAEPVSPLLPPPLLSLSLSQWESCSPHPSVLVFVLFLSTRGGVFSSLNCPSCTNCLDLFVVLSPLIQPPHKTKHTHTKKKE